MSWDSPLSLELFMALAQHPKLTHLWLHCQYDSWIYQSLIDQEVFKKITKLHLTLDDKEAQLILPLMPHIPNLTISVTGVSVGILKPISRAISLRKLRVMFGGGRRHSSSITGEQLLAIASNCQSLRSISIGDNDQWPTAIIVSYATMELFARLLPHLKLLKITMWESQLTLRSLLYIGQNCKTLTRLTLCAFIDIHEFTEEAPSDRFPLLI